MPASFIDVQVSPHFKLSEFAQPERHGCPYEPYPRIWLADRLVPLCVQVLEPLRASVAQRFGERPFTVLSGWRSVAYNNALYAAAGKPPTDSQHSYGRAADIVAKGVPAGWLHSVALDMFRAGQLPLLGGLGLYTGFIHVDIRPQQPKGHLAQWTGSRTAEQT